MQEANQDCMFANALIITSCHIANTDDETVQRKGKFI